MRCRFIATFLVIMLASIIIPHVAHAQVSVNSTFSEVEAVQKKVDEFVGQLTSEEINALARVRVKNILIEANETAKTLQNGKPGFFESFKLGWATYKHFVWGSITGFPQGISGSYQAVSAVFRGRNFLSSVQFITLIAIALALGLAAEYLANKFTRSWRVRVTKADNQNLVATLKILGQHLAAELVGLIAFAITALLTVRYIITDALDGYLAFSFILITILVVRFMAAFLRFTLDPNKTSLRLVSADDWTAQFIYSKLVVVTTIVGIGFYMLFLMNQFEIVGIKPFRFWVGLYIYASIIYVTWRGRKGLASIIKGQDERLTPGLERMASWWPAISIVVIIGQYLLTQIAASTGAYNISAAISIMTLSIIVLLPFLDTMVRGIIKYLVPPMVGEGPVAEAAYYRTRHSYARVGRVLLISLLVMFIGMLWGINFQNLAASGFGAQLAANLLGSLMVLAIGYLIWEAVNLWINRKLAKDMPVDESDGAGDGEGGGAGKSRLATVLPLIQMALQFTIITITALLMLSRLGVNITPLLAGAGVLGLAVGFGAQTLVKDIVSGVFFLLDDAFRVGEYIDIGGTVGTVEKISVRSLQLRHPNGPVHIVPYGEIPKLTNNSRDYVIVKLRFTVPFETDLEKVRKLFKKIGQEMMQNPVHAENFIQPFKSQGVADVDDIGIVLRGKFMTKPGAQWIIRKEIYSRVQKAFEENGIEFARKEVRVNIPDLGATDKLNKDQMEAIAAAASSAATDEDNSDQSKKKEPDPI